MPEIRLKRVVIFDHMKAHLPFFKVLAKSPQINSLGHFSCKWNRWYSTMKIRFKMLVVTARKSY